jgi:hypothetical protein
LELEFNQPDKRGIPIFMLGALIGFAYFLIVFFQDTEAIVFSALASGDETLRSLSCPEVLTTGENGEVQARIANHTDKQQYRSVRANVTQGFLTLRREEMVHTDLEPGEELPLSWSVYPEDAAYGYLILAKVFVFPQEPYPSYVGACGMLLLDLPWARGWMVITAFWVVSLVLMAAGYLRYLRANPLLVAKKRRLALNLQVIALTVVAGMATMFLEFWYIELGLFIFTIILLAESVFSFSQA